ncbi:hypothetical protein HQQ80_16775 [Microbacteriaceae bacterium VKM Ac-2855]|nr:hypothetical protein [Microbacteriaceae bacterium VKM Ac-2855]
MAGQRPGGVVLIAVLAWIGAVLQILSGALVLGGVVVVESVSTESAWLGIIVGSITFLIAFALFTGSNGARILVTISFVLSLFAAVVSMIAHPANLVPPIVAGFLALIGLILLYTQKSNIYFRT